MSSAASDVRNYFKLQLLVGESRIMLRRVFKNRYALYSGGQLWDDSPTCGNNYFTNVVKKNKNIKLFLVQKDSILNGDSNEWDVATLTALLLNAVRPRTLDAAQIQQIDDENKFLHELREIRNSLAHHKSMSVTDIEFNQYWSQIATILVAFGDIPSELEKLKDNSVFDTSVEVTNEENMKEAQHLNSLGTEAHKEKQFSDAITLFTKAIALPGVAKRDRALFYSNISSSRLALFEQQGVSRNYDINGPIDQRYRALQDAKEARHILMTWWKGHYRVGKAYAALNEEEKAMISFERALALAPEEKQILEALGDCRQILGRQSRHEHLDPRLTSRTVPEQLNDLHQRLGVDSQQVRLEHKMLETIYPSGADVIKAHKYEHGDIDVKQDYEQAAKYFSKAASQENAEGMYNFARLTDLGLGVKKDHKLALAMYERAAKQPPEHPTYKGHRNPGVSEAEHALGLKYADGIGVHKNLSTAAQWYQRAVDHGSAEAANNLASMYQSGTGMNKNSQKAEQLFELSAVRGDPNAMVSLALVLLNKNDLEMSKIWFDRACEVGNVNAQNQRDTFESYLREKQQLKALYPPTIEPSIATLQKAHNSVCTTRTTHDIFNGPHTYDANVLNEYVKCGSIIAKNICDALKHFAEASEILMQPETLSEEQEDRFVHELSHCYRIERSVAQISNIEMSRKVNEIVDRVLQRYNTKLNAVLSPFDEDIRICYATLHVDSPELVIKFLQQCQEKYPKSAYFFQLSAILYGSLGQHEAGLYNVNSGLEIDPKSCELLYQKAVTLNSINQDMDETIKAYQAFLTVAPNDHPKVPESYYAMAICYLVYEKHPLLASRIEKIYQHGEETEKKQLPYFLPYVSNTKILLRQKLHKECSISPDATLAINRELLLKNSHRIDIFKTHREHEATASQTDHNPQYMMVSQTVKPRVKQQIAKSLIGLKSISLKQMNPTKDHVYNGYVISVTIIEKAYSWAHSIHLVIQDDNSHCERLFIYDFSETQGDYLINEVFTIGSKMSIINPYLRIGAADMKPLVRVDDYSSIIMQNESDRVVNMCRCCGEPNASHICGKCEGARYCSKECETIDWKLYGHKLMCKAK